MNRSPSPFGRQGPALLLLIGSLLWSAVAFTDDDKETVLVLDVDTRLAPRAKAMATTTPAKMARVLGRFRGITPLTGDDLRTLTELEAQRQEMGCDATSCLAELASALGARFVLSTQATVDGAATRLTLSLLDSADATIVGRSSIVGTEGELNAQLPFAVDTVVATLRRPEDPPIGAMIREQRQLALLPPIGPIRLTNAAATTAAIRAAADGAARRLDLIASEDTGQDLVKRSGCVASDARCLMPAAAAAGARLGLRVGFSPTAEVTVEVLKPDGSVAGVATRPKSNDIDLDTQLADAADAACDAALGVRSRTTSSNTPGSAARPAMKPTAKTAKAAMTAPAVLLAPEPQTRQAPASSMRRIVDADEDEFAPAPMKANGKAKGKVKATLTRPRPRPCRLTDGGTTLGGRCLVSDGRFTFVPLSSSARKATVDLPLEGIAKVKSKRKGFVENGIEVSLVDGATFVIEVELEQHEHMLRVLREGSQSPGEE